VLNFDQHLRLQNIMASLADKFEPMVKETVDVEDIGFVFVAFDNDPLGRGHYVTNLKDRERVVRWLRRLADRMEADTLPPEKGEA